MRKIQWQGFIAGCCFITATLDSTPLWLTVLCALVTGGLMLKPEEAPRDRLAGR